MKVSVQCIIDAFKHCPANKIKFVKENNFFFFETSRNSIRLHPVELMFLKNCVIMTYGCALITFPYFRYFKLYYKKTLILKFIQFIIRIGARE